MTIYISTGTKGAINELLVCAWLLRQGYEIYRNVSQNGKFDIIALNGNEIRKIDVTMMVNGCICPSKQKKSKLYNGYIVYVLEDGSCHWDYEYNLEKIKHVCLICNVEFKTFRKQRMTCGNKGCQEKLQKIRYKEWHNNKLKK